MLYPKEDKENRILLYAVREKDSVDQTDNHLSIHLFSVVVVNINKQQIIHASTSIR